MLTNQHALPTSQASSMHPTSSPKKSRMQHTIFAYVIPRWYHVPTSLGSHTLCLPISLRNQCSHTTLSCLLPQLENMQFQQMSFLRKVKLGMAPLMTMTHCRVRKVKLGMAPLMTMTHCRVRGCQHHVQTHVMSHLTHGRSHGHPRASSLDKGVLM